MRKLIIIFILFLLFYAKNNLGYFYDISVSSVDKGDVIICMGGGNGKRLKKSIEIFKKINPKYHYVLSSDANQKDRDRKNTILIKENFKRIKYLSFTKNTYEELKIIKDFIQKNNLNNIIFISEPTHSRRIDILIKNFYKFNELNIKYTIISYNSVWWDKNNIFKSKKSIKSIIIETTKIIYNLIYYNLIIYLNLDLKKQKFIDDLKKLFITNINKLFS